MRTQRPLRRLDFLERKSLDFHSPLTVGAMCDPAPLSSPTAPPVYAEQALLLALTEPSLQMKVSPWQPAMPPFLPLQGVFAASAAPTIASRMAVAPKAKCVPHAPLNASSTSRLLRRQNSDQGRSRPCRAWCPAGQDRCRGPCRRSSRPSLARSCPPPW